MTVITILVGLITLVIECFGFFFIKGRDRWWLVFLMVITLIVFLTAYMLQGI